MSTVRRASTLSLAALLAVGGLSACSSGSSSSSSSPAEASSAAASPSTEATPNGIADKSADEILTESKAAAEAASSFRVEGNVPGESGDTTFDLQFTTTGATGEMSQGSGSFEIIYTPDMVYIQGDDAFNKQFGGESAGALLNGKWLGIPTKDQQAQSFAAFKDGKSFLSGVLTPNSEPTVGDTSEINGTPAIALTTTSGDLWIATVGEPYPLQVTQTGAAGEINFSDWDAPVTVTAPPQDQVVDISQLNKSN